jgi:predicted O-methyltransferase YrrM
VDSALRTLLDELAAHGRRHDAVETDRRRRLLNITPDTGRLLAILVRASRATRILEIGTSNGYSTIWLAWASTATGGHVTTIERSAEKLALARANVEQAGFTEQVTVREGLAAEVLAQLRGPYDLVFLDADRPNYLAYLRAVGALLRPGGLLVTDNVVSHADELREFMAALEADPALETVIVPVGNGQALSYKAQ